MNIRNSHRQILLTVLSLTLIVSSNIRGQEISLGQGQMAGEPTETSVILQSRLTAGDKLIDGDLPGKNGVGRFEIATSADFKDSITTEWLTATPESDYILKSKINKLQSGTKYYYRLHYGLDKKKMAIGPTCTFQTLKGKASEQNVNFVVVTGINYWKLGMRKNPPPSAGYPALDAILAQKPDFLVGTGDTVYYDHPETAPAKTQIELRKKWHEQFVQPQFGKLFAQVPTYWEKDDHDFGFDDSDPDKMGKDFATLGVNTFLEQMPVLDPKDRGVTYRTHRPSKYLQIWLVEGRDYRSPNAKTDGPEKSVWGREQREWLKKTLLESDATFKLLISPTPMVGPDDDWKWDNHVNPQGFRHEGDEFFRWLKENNFLNKNFYIICGDRHWQYQSIHPSGFEEFSCGALDDSNARIGRIPGDPQSTDPKATIKQPYTQKEASGGFIKVSVKKSAQEKAPTMEILFLDEHGEKLQSVVKTGK
jgi:alkaline phosphatase D